MSQPRADLVIRGQVVIAAGPDGLETAEAVGIRAGRVVAAGGVSDVADAAAAGARTIDARDAAVVPGLHDFHIHLAALARARSAVRLDDAADGAEVVARVRAAASGSGDGWITGRGWSEAQLAALPGGVMAEASGNRLVFLASHDGHSAWASPPALRRAAIDDRTSDPPGGRIERDSAGAASGILRETALDLVASLVPEPQGAALRPALTASLADLAALGLTGASEAGDYTAEGGIGAEAAFGDSYSSLTDLGEVIDGRLRLTLGIPVDAIPAAAARGLHTGAPLAGRRTLRFGWAKEYADGALGSGTAAVFTPRTCGEVRDSGILRVTAEELDELFQAARPAGIALAIHAIGDRAAAAVLDAVERAPARVPNVPRDRMEHAQLLRSGDIPRFARLGITASVQPIHAAADRDLVEACWQGRQDGAYAWRSLADAGAHLAAGSDAPIESVNPWLGIFAAIHRRFPTDARGDWRPGQALRFSEALRAYTLGPALAIGAPDEGHLRPGARADLAILSVDLPALTSGDERLAGVRAVQTLVDGVETHSA